MTISDTVNSSAPPPLIQLEGLSKSFPIHKGFFNRQVGQVQAVTDIDLNIYHGETLGVVGESGCGKSTLGRCILQLLRPTSGHVYLNLPDNGNTRQNGIPTTLTLPPQKMSHFSGTSLPGKRGGDFISSQYKRQDLTTLNNAQLRPLRREMQIIFQNPYSSLDPRMTIGETLAEPLQIHGLAQGKALQNRIHELLDMVGLPKDAFRRYPHEFSGGQRQRVGIARAIALNPRFIVADEPVSALDVSIQAQILNLLDDLKKSFNLTYLFIAHNLSVVEYISDRVAVMYLGRIVELASASSLYHRPLHPYTQALLSAIPLPDPTLDRSQRILLEGDLPNPAHPPSGCRFHTRCPYVIERCRQEIPEGIEYLPGHVAYCHRVPELNHLERP